MKIDRSLLHQIAHLARIEVNDLNEVALLDNLNKIISWTEQLKEVDTSGVSPLTTMASERNIFQEDTPAASMTFESALTGAPSKDSNYFRVPQVKE